MNKFIALLFVLIMGSCATQNTDTSEKNVEGKWELITLDGKDVISKKPIVLHLDDNSLSGYAGCNQVSGMFTTQNSSQIEFKNIATTRMMCAEEQMTLETNVVEMLNTVNNYTIDKDILSLNIGKRAPLATLHRMSDNEIVGKYWKLIELDGQKVTMADNQEKERYFAMNSKGTFRGFAGCNTFNGNYEIKDGMQIKFDDNIAVTLRSCPDVNINEADFLEVFKTANNYSISEDKLYLNVGKRMPLAVFEAVYF